MSPGGKRGRNLKGQNDQCPLDLPETLLRKENEDEGKGALLLPSFLRRGWCTKTPGPATQKDWATHHQAAVCPTQHQGPNPQHQGQTRHPTLYKWVERTPHCLNYLPAPDCPGSHSGGGGGGGEQGGRT